MTTQLPRIEYALAMEPTIGAGGLREQDLSAEADAFRAAHGRIMEAVRSQQLGFWKLPGQPGLAAGVRELADSLREGIDDVLVLGIGGSSLGARAALHALSSPLVGSGLDGPRPRVHLPDNSDPWLFGALLKALDPDRTLALVVSKSGGTVETAAQLLCVRKWLEDGVGRAALPRHLVAITDPEKGSLRALARELGLRTLPIPSNVGGRFSVLSAAGLLPLALCGLDVEGLLEGGQAMASRCETATLVDNPAGVLAALHVLHTRVLAHPIHVLMPYADALRPFAAWFVQLWAESLGKRVDRLGRVVETGPTPLPAVGATDQHAQVQLFIEGPRDKLVTFVAVDELATDVTLPAAGGDLSYLSGHSLGELLRAELRGTALALARNGRPSLSVHLPRLDAPSLGALFFLFEAATAFAGELMGIDAFDQPGVEEGKRLAFGLLGREGYGEHREQVERHERERSTAFRIE